ncbi:Pinoresinol reductase 2 [Fusarium oxysporum f. sp. raphani]|uniref:Pinoresinol reductase 2 n=1 Tax=Fusarium oxysporum f. sp. raphani TaxID=96318 RepID=A0A8J5TYH2_FUSOX|nr:Pinoresinol reductase 2 [Fusarium oxysporum f. sp. raphani]
MKPIEKVVVAGARGSVGPYIVSALLEHGFAVTALTRTKLGNSFPEHVKVVETDYSAISLQSALEGQDAIVCTLGHAVLDKQLDIIEAAEKAGVRRYIPSEFGVPKGLHDVPEYAALLGKKQKVMELLKEKSEKNPHFTWSSFVNGAFLDRALALFPEFGFDVKSHSANIIDSGNEPFTAMSIDNIGQPVARVLQNPEDTKNRYVHISAMVTSQNEILATLEKFTHKIWNTRKLSSSDVKRDAESKLRDGDFKGAYVGLLVVQLFEDGTGRAVSDGVDNDMLGVVPEKLEDIVRRVLA